MAEQVIGYIASFALVVAIGWGLPRWFGWRYAVRRRLVDATDDGGRG